jgi:hypothetical protein
MTIYSIGSALLFGPFMVLVWAAVAVRLRQLRRTRPVTPALQKEIFAYRGGVWFGLPLVLFAFLPWVRLAVAAGVDWAQGQVRVIEIRAYRSADEPPTTTCPTTLLSDPKAVSVLLDLLARAEPYELHKEHPLGPRYELRARLADGSWSHYHIVVYTATSSGSSGLLTIVRGSGDLTINNAGYRLSRNLVRYLESLPESDSQPAPDGEDTKKGTNTGT